MATPMESEEDDLQPIKGELSIRNKLYMKISEHLSEDEVRSLRAMMITDKLIGRGTVQNLQPHEIFNMLEVGHQIGRGDLGLLKELLKALGKRELVMEAKDVEKKEGIKVSNVNKRDAPEDILVHSSTKKLKVSSDDEGSDHSDSSAESGIGCSASASPLRDMETQDSEDGSNTAVTAEDTTNGTTFATVGEVHKQIDYLRKKIAKLTRDPTNVSQQKSGELFNACQELGHLSQILEQQRTGELKVDITLLGAVVQNEFREGYETGALGQEIQKKIKQIMQSTSDGRVNMKPDVKVDFSEGTNESTNSSPEQLATIKVTASDVQLEDSCKLDKDSAVRQLFKYLVQNTHKLHPIMEYLNSFHVQIRSITYGSIEFKCICLTSESAVRLQEEYDGQSLHAQFLRVISSCTILTEFGIKEISLAVQLIFADEGPRLPLEYPNHQPHICRSSNMLEALHLDDTNLPNPPEEQYDQETPVQTDDSKAAQVVTNLSKLQIEGEVPLEIRKRCATEDSAPPGKHHKPASPASGNTTAATACGPECSSTSSDLRFQQETSQKETPYFPMEIVPFGTGNSDEIEDFPDIPFHGRQKELREIKHKFSEEHCRIGQISGLPGMGKSRLAKEAALQISMECQERNISLKSHSLDLRNVKNTNLIIDTVFADLLGVDFTGTISTRESLVAALEKVKRLEGFHLFILDNVDAIVEDGELRSQLLDVVCDIIRASSKVFFLVTSSTKFRLAKEQHIFFSIHLRPLVGDEARHLLMTLAPNVPTDHFSDIADLCGGLPLALTIAGNELKHNEEEPGYTPEELIELIRGNVLESPLSDESYRKSEQVGHVLGSAVHRLTEVLKKHYAALNFIPGSFSTAAAAAVTGEESTAVVKAHALRPLRQRSLLEFDFQNSQERWDINPLLRNIVQTSLSSHLDLGLTRRRYCIFFADALKTIGNAMAKDASGVWAFTADYRNIEKMMLEAINCSDDNAYRVFIDAAFEGEKVLMQYMRDPNQTLPFYTACHNSAMVCGTLKERARILTIIGFALANYQGSPYEAYEKYMQAKQLIEQEGDSTILARLYSNIGGIYHTRGQHEEAISSLETSLEMWERLKQGPHLGKAITLATLGIVHGFVGNHMEAKEYYERCLEMRIEMVGKDHPLIGPSKNNLAIAYDKLGEKETALQLHQEALDMKRRWFKKPAQTKVESLNNVAEQYMYRKDYDKALQYLQEAEQMQKEVTYVDDEQSVLSNVNLGKVFVHTGQYKQAEEHLRIAATWYEERLKTHILTAEALEFLGMALQGQRRLEEAKAMLTRALDMYKKVSGKVDVQGAIPRTRALLEGITSVSNTTTPSAVQFHGTEEGGSNDTNADDMQAIFGTISSETGYKWPDLARRLGLTEAQIQDVGSKHRGNLKESCMDVLDTWQKKEGTNVSIQVLRDALVDASLQAIAEELEGSAEEKAEAVNRKQKLQGVFYTIAENTGPSKWKDLARKLGLKPAQIDGIETRHPREVKECCMDVLETWRLGEGGAATIQALQHALREADLTALADDIDMSPVQ